MRVGPNANIRHSFVVHIVLRTLHSHDKHLLQIVLLRSEARQEHKGGYEATRTVVSNQELQVQEQTRQNTKATGQNEAYESVSRLGSQGCHNGRCNNGCIFDLLGSLLLRQYCRGFLQDVHTRSCFSGKHEL